LNSDKKRVAELDAKVTRLESLIEKSLDKVDDLKHRKNSRNGSVSPSKDENRPLITKSLRANQGKKVGGQPGHDGNTLEMIANPDVIIEHKPEFCNHCGDDLSDEPATFMLRRQVVDIPPITAEFTEHRVFQKSCACGHHTKALFPSGINSPISYGSNIQATIAYMHTRQYLPFERMSEFFSDVCNLKISQGTLCTLLKGFAQKAQPAYELIAQKVENEKVVGGDETGAKVNGKKGWFWTFQSQVATYITFSNNRGTATIDKNFPNGFTNSILVHDCWRSYFQIKCKTHQICIPHLLRELVFFEERYESQWAINFKELLYEAIELKRNLTPIQYLNPILQRDRIMERLSILLLTPVSKNRKDLCAFHKRIHKYKQYVFTFLFHNQVPPDNNASERAIRNVKVKQKVSGQFKTENGAQYYAVIRSVTDTCIKNGQNVLAAFKTIAILQPE
jgi:transposase